MGNGAGAAHYGRGSSQRASRAAAGTCRRPVDCLRAADPALEVLAGAAGEPLRAGIVTSPVRLGGQSLIYDYDQATCWPVPWCEEATLNAMSRVKGSSPRFICIWWPVGCFSGFWNGGAGFAALQESRG